MNLVLEALGRGLGVCLVALGAAGLLRRRSAAWRHAALAAGALGLGLVWLLPLLPARVEVPVLPPAPPVAEDFPAFVPIAEETAPAARAGAPATASVASPTLANPVDLWPWIYGAGVVASLAPVLVGLVQSGRLRRRSVGAGVVREADVAAPMALAVWPPTILLPRRRAWTADEERAVLAHEWAHVRRGDPWTGLAARLLAALHWPNPLAWWLVARLRVEAEIAADDAALREGLPAPDYAQTLVRLATHQAPATAVPMARSSGLKGQIARTLDAQADRRPVGRIAWATAIALALVATLAGATVLMPQEQSERVQLVAVQIGSRALDVKGQPFRPFCPKPLRRGQVAVLVRATGGGRLGSNPGWHSAGMQRGGQVYIASPRPLHSLPPLEMRWQKGPWRAAGDVSFKRVKASEPGGRRYQYEMPATDEGYIYRPVLLDAQGLPTGERWGDLMNGIRTIRKDVATGRRYWICSAALDKDDPDLARVVVQRLDQRKVTVPIPARLITKIRRF